MSGKKKALLTAIGIGILSFFLGVAINLFAISAIEELPIQNTVSAVACGLIGFATALFICSKTIK